MHGRPAIEQDCGNGTSDSVQVGNRLKYIVWPVTPESISDEKLAEIWQIIETQGHVDQVFPDGHIITAADFVAFMRRDGILPVLVWDKRRTLWVFLAWLDHFEGDWARAHFCGLEGRYRDEIGQEAVNAFSSMVEVGLIGVIPERNKTAQKVVDRLGWKRMGSIPKYCYNAEYDKRESGVIFHHLIRR